MLYTIGYEGAHIEDFVATLKAADVSLLLDVREIALSRRPGFSKTALSTHIGDAGIPYRHEKRLGSPTKIRNQLHNDGDLKRYFKGFDKYLATQAELLDQLVDELPENTVLLCYERDPATCHRSAVAAALAKRSGLKVKHLGVRTREYWKTHKASRVGACQSVSAA